AGEPSAAVASLGEAPGIAADAATQLVEYLATGRAALGTMPTHSTIVFERFFDESGGMQLVIHSPFGSRLNRAWGLALRKRFCRKFNFELQAAATEDAIVLSLSTSHSFELAAVARYLNSNTVRDVLVQAMLDAPMFAARWRWVAGIALALPRFRGGKKVPAPLQRMRAEDLIAAVFPDQIACAENLTGEREIPDHPLVRQVVHDCLYEAMDIEGLERLLRRIESGEIRIVARELASPSPLALEILTARPYAYLDDAPLEERRTQAVMARRWLDQEQAATLGALDAAAIERVRSEAWPVPENADEMHDALLGLAFVTPAEVASNERWAGYLDELARAGRATRASMPAVPSAASAAGALACDIWVAAERLPQLRSVAGALTTSPPIAVPDEFARRAWTRESALVEVVRSRLEGLGPVASDSIAASIGVPIGDVEVALESLAAQGVAIAGAFTPSGPPKEWCDRALLARIHRYTVARLRQEIEPVGTRDFMRFLFRWQHLVPNERREGPDALDVVISQLQGFEAPVAAWESELLPARLDAYDMTWLDDLCLSGRAVWTRLTPPAATASSSHAAPIRTTPVTLLPRRAAALWHRVAPAPSALPIALSGRAQAVVNHLRQHGASFYDEIVDGTGLLRTQVEEALAELVALGVATSDSFAGLRALITPSEKRRPFGAGGRRHRRALFGIEDAGRWALRKREAVAESAALGFAEIDPQVVEPIVHALLRRYGVVFWKILQRESAWLPPWREMLRVLRRLEARGDIRGGRFVAGLSGEQYALPEAVKALRDARRAPLAGEWVAISAADPLNLVGTVLPGTKIPALTANRVLYRDGVAVGALVAGEMRWLEALTPAELASAEAILIRQRAHAASLANAA
ncbi:MAG TPA: ATP-dependent DNA helicase, partial [Casimicrobiaceae bacterium]|nr:ATP-dependent DNA helicase [Casimicrobiaceae bacterium]